MSAAVDIFTTLQNGAAWRGVPGEPPARLVGSVDALQRFLQIDLNTVVCGVVDFYRVRSRLKEVQGMGPLDSVRAALNQAVAG